MSPVWHGHAACPRGRGQSPWGLAEALAESLRSVTGRRGEIELVVPGSLPNDGEIIDDPPAAI
jgi:hypothetical protein